MATGTSTILASSPNLEWTDRPCWTPDGRVVALEYRSTRWSLQRRYVAYRSLSSRTVLGNTSRYVAHAQLAPGCGRVAEARRRLAGGGRGTVVRDLLGVPVATFRSFGSLNGPPVAWSADGALVAGKDDSAGEPDIAVVDPADGRAVLRVPVADDASVPVVGAFAPDRPSLLVVGGGRLPELLVLDLATSSFRPLGSFEGLTAVAWSPRGDRIAVVLDRLVHLIDLDGRDLGIVAPAARTLDVAWSPDGTQIAFSTLRATGTSHYVAAAEPGAPHRLLLTTRALNATPLAWSPDGTRIAVGGG